MAPGERTSALGVRAAARLGTLAFVLGWSADRRAIVQLLACQIASAAIIALQLLAVRWFLEALSRRDGASAMTVVLQIATLSAAAVGVAAIQGRSQTAFAHALSVEANLRMMRYITRRDLASIEGPEFAEWLRTGYSAVLTRPTAVANAVLGIARSCAGLVLTCAVIASLAPALLPVIVLARLPSLRSSFRLARSNYDASFTDADRERERAYITGLFTSMPSLREIQHYDALPYLEKRYDTLSREQAVSMRRKANANIPTLTYSAMFAAGAAALTYAGIIALLSVGAIGIPSSAALILASAQVNGLLVSLLNEVAALYEHALYLQNGAAMLERQGDQPSADGRVLPTPVRFALDDVTFRYRMAQPELRPALTDASVVVECGELVALVGPNGSGKSTLAKLLAGLYTPTAGRVLFDARDISAAPRDWVRASVSILHQDFGHYMLSVRENIGLSEHRWMFDNEAISAAAQTASADGFIGSLPSAYETKLGTLTTGRSQLSIGQWQRLAVARALFRRAQLMILDEPTSAIDPTAEAFVMEQLRLLARTRAVLYVTHRASSVAYADRVYVLANGRVVQSGPPHELAATSGPYSDLFGRDDEAAARAGHTLAPRELQVLRLAARGLSDKEIAYELGIAPATVRTVLQRLYRRENFRNRTHAVAQLLMTLGGSDGDSVALESSRRVL